MYYLLWIVHFFWLLSVTQPDGPKKVVDKYDWARDLHVKSQKEAEKKRGRVKQAVHGYELEIPVFYQGDGRLRTSIAANASKITTIT